jgi:hypothetical protein
MALALFESSRGSQFRRAQRFRAGLFVSAPPVIFCSHENLNVVILKPATILPAKSGGCATFCPNRFYTTKVAGRQESLNTDIRISGYWDLENRKIGD